MLVFICLPALTSAQVPPMSQYDLQDNSTPPDPCTDPFDYCPIDSGLYALLAVGVGYGVLKAREARKHPATS